MFLYPEEIDTRLNWPLGTAARLARRKRLPHVILPDGSLRFVWDSVAALVRHVPGDQLPPADSDTQDTPAGTDLPAKPLHRARDGRRRRGAD